MTVIRLILGIYSTNCYIVGNEVTHECLIIDPADAGHKILEVVQQKEYQMKAILLTHDHWDHTLAVPKLQKYIPSLPVYVHKNDIPKDGTKMLFDKDFRQNFPTVAAFENVYPINDGDILKNAGLMIKVYHTPGHTPGSVCYDFYEERVMFSGDTLFHRSIGQTIFDGGNEQDMVLSLKKLKAFRGERKVYPGHDIATDLSFEKENNPFMKQL